MPKDKQKPEVHRTVITKRPNGFKRVQIFFEEGKTEPQHAGDLDVKKIVARATAGGGLPQSDTPLQFFDTTQFPDFQKAQDLVLNMRNRFMALPSELRDLLGNKPENLEKWLKDRDNNAKAVKLGLIKNTEIPLKKSEAPPPGSTPPVAPTPPSPGDK